MALKSLFHVIGFSLAIGVAFASTANSAEPPSPAQALALKPIQPNVEYTTPSEKEIPLCTVKLEHDGNASYWVVKNRQGETLRRFYDTNGDNVVDMWCYYLNGMEVYRDIDSNFNNKADQYRWFNTAGTRWGIDKNEDNQIDSWKVISPQEVAEQVVLAIKNRDVKQFELLLPTPSEITAMGFGPNRTQSITESVKNAPAAFSKWIADQTTVTAQTRYVDYSSGRPATIPAGTAGSTKDVTICDNATALIQTENKHDQVYLGTIIAVGDTWKLIDVPTFGSDNQPAGGFLTGPNSPQQNAGPADNQPSDKMQKLMADLEALDKEAENATPDQIAANIDKRLTTLQSLADVTPEKDRDQWYRQMVDVIGIAVQSGNYPDGGDRLEQLQKKLTDAKADPDLIAHAAFQRLWSQYAAAQKDAKANGSQLQEKWLTDLQAFVTQFPKSTDTAEALFQLGMYQEFMGKGEEASKSYQQLVSNFPNANQVTKANGALRRLGSMGKPIALRGPELQGGTVDVTSAKYRGKVVLIHYWASIGERWKQDMVLLQDFYAKKGGASGNFEIIGVCLDEDPAGAKRYISENKIPWKQIYERGGLENRLAMEMGVITLPLMILVDQKGNVANQNLQTAQLDAELDRLTKPATDAANALRSTPTSR